MLFWIRTLMYANNLTATGAPMKPKPFWTPDEFLASGECPYGRSVLYRLLNEGKIPAIRHSRSFVIPKAAWHRHLETCGGMLAAQ
jgi:hypothetical protein